MHRLFGKLAGGLVTSLVACALEIHAAELAKPLVDLKFDSAQLLPPGSTFRRPSLATMVGPDGQIHGGAVRFPQTDSS